MLGSLAYVVLMSTKLIIKITVTHTSTILRLIFVDFDNPAQRKRCEFSKSYARAAITTICLISYSQSFAVQLHIPNRVVKFDDRDPPWMKQELNTAIKRKHRVYAKFVKRGRKMEDWNHVKNLQNETTKMINNCKNE